MRRFLTTEPYVRPFYWSMVSLLRFLLTVFTRWRVEGRKNVPRSGPVIIVSNHLHNADPPVLGAALARRRIRFMAKIELFRMPGGIIPKLWGAFPVRREEMDREALRSALAVLRNGEVLGMFPEGTRSRTGQLGTPHRGTATLALRTGTTVVPCAIAGSEQLTGPSVLWRRPRISVRIGEPILVERTTRPTSAEASELTERMFETIRVLLPPQYRGTYTESTDSNEA